MSEGLWVERILVFASLTKLRQMWNLGRILGIRACEILGFWILRNCRIEGGFYDFLCARFCGFMESAVDSVDS